MSLDKNNFLKKLITKIVTDKKRRIGKNKKISKIKSCFFEKINKIHKPLSIYTKKKERILKLLKLKMKVEILLLILQKKL